LLNVTKYPEYKESVYDLLSTLLDSAMITPTVYAEYKKDIIRLANDELKRQLASEENTNSDSKYNYDYDDYSDKAAKAAADEMAKLFNNSLYNGDYDYNDGQSLNWQLVNYYNLLGPFYTEPSIKNIFDKGLKTKSNTLKISLITVMLKHKIAVEDSLINNLAKNIDTRSYLYSSLKKIKQENKIKPEYATQQNISYALLYGEEDEDYKSDSIEFIEKRFVKNKEGSGYIYFYKSKRKDDLSNYIDYIGFQPKDSISSTTETEIYRKKYELDKDKTVTEQIDEICSNISLYGRKRVKRKSDYNYGDYYDDY